MADEADIANDYINDAILRSLERMQKNQKHAPNLIGSKTCRECGEDIPELRQNLGFKLCIACAEEAERRQSRFA